MDLSLRSSKDDELASGETDLSMDVTPKVSTFPVCCWSSHVVANEIARSSTGTYKYFLVH